MSISYILKQVRTAKSLTQEEVAEKVGKMKTGKETRHTKRFYILVGIPVILVFLCIVGAIWNTLATRSERAAYPPAGQIVEVFDTKIHVFEVGQRQAGQPAILFFAGLATPSPVADFYPLWSRMVGEYCVVLERSGYGWSASTKRERTIQNITEEYRAALQVAGINPPYILVAHSMGGMEANLLAADYPEEIHGVVLLDSTSPESMLSYENSVQLLNRIIPAMRFIGLLRLINTVNPNALVNQSAGMRNGFSMLDEYHKNLDGIFVLQQYQNAMMIGEQKMRMVNAETAANNPFPANMPVSLIVAVREGDENHPQYQKFMRDQEKWVNQSEHGQVYTMIGRHYIHHYAPDEVCDVITSISNR